MLKCIDRRGVLNTNWAQYTSTVTINPLRADINTAVTVFGLQRLTPNSVRRILSPPYAAPHLQRTTGAAVAELSTGGTRASLSSLTQSRSSFWLPGMPDKGVHRLSFKWAGKPSPTLLSSFTPCQSLPVIGSAIFIPWTECDVLQ